jgi:hypothetical protein
MAVHFYQYPSIVVTNAGEVATAANGAGTLPSLLKVVAGWDGTNVRVVRTDATGAMVTVSSYLDSSETIRNDYSVTPVTTGAWVQLVASTLSDVKEIEIFDSSGQTLELGLGGSGSEVRKIIIFPGGNGRIPCQIAAGSRVSIQAISANASVGEIDINFYG